MSIITCADSIQIILFFSICSQTLREGIRIYIHDDKTAAGEREITITRDLSSDLKKRFNSGKIVSFDGYIFQSKNGTPLRPNQIERAWKSILLLASVPHKKFHVLRHTHATQLLANGVPLLEVSKRLGHSRASHTLDLYGHAIPGYDASLPNKISKIFNL